MGTSGRVVTTLLATVFFLLSTGDRTKESPRDYTIQLTQLEYNILQASAAVGIQDHGGDAEFSIKIARDGARAATYVTIHQQKDADALTRWIDSGVNDLREKAKKENPAGEFTKAMDAGESIARKLTFSKANPVWPKLQIEGLAVEENGKRLIVSVSKNHQLANVPASWPRMVNKRVIATGLSKNDGEIEITQIRESKKDSLELFVMSECPYAKQTEYNIIEKLKKQRPGDPLIQIEIRYLFQPKASPDGQADSYTSLHGEAEVNEDLIQMMIRDNFKNVFLDYVCERAQSNEPWRQLATKIGITVQDCDYLETVVTNFGPEFLHNEYVAMVDSYGSLNKSPTLIWEGRIVEDPKEVPFLRDVMIPSPTCGGIVK